MLNITKSILTIVAIFFMTATWAQQNAKILSEELIYNFGTIAEADGFATHTFTIKNTGNAPLVITRITASCGCTRPEWTKAPIAPGKTGEVKITYNPKGRPGPFYKTISIFSNGKNGSYSLAIKGNVTPKPLQPIFNYPYAIGDLKLHTKTILFSSIREHETQGEKINIKNEGKTSAIIHLGKLPHFLTAQVNPSSLQPNEEGAITILLDAKAIKKKGRITTSLPVEIRNTSEKGVTGEIHIAANIIDDFSNLSAAEKAKAPIAKLSGTLLEFGKLPNKKSIVPLIGGKVIGTFDITNGGKTPLNIHSVTCDDERVDVSGGKKVLKPSMTTTFKVTLRPKEIKTRLEALINIVCNDPNGPIRLIKVTAYK